jgi:hypothetical protein
MQKLSQVPWVMVVRVAGLLLQVIFIFVFEKCFF